MINSRKCDCGAPRGIHSTDCYIYDDVMFQRLRDRLISHFEDVFKGYNLDAWREEEAIYLVRSFLDEYPTLDPNRGMRVLSRVEGYLYYKHQGLKRPDV